MDKDVVHIPPSAVGYLGGKKGCRIQDLARRSGAKMNVSFENATVTIMGTPKARAAAAKMVESTLQHALSPIMKKVSRLVVLGNGFREPNVTGVQFERYGGSLDYFNAGKTVYRLNTSTQSEPETVEDEDTFDLLIDLTNIEEPARIAEPTAEESNSGETDDSVDISKLVESIQISEPITDCLHLNVTDSESGKPEKSADITAIVQSLQIGEPSAVATPSQETNTTPKEPIKRRRSDRTKMIRNTGTEEVVHFIGDEVMDYTNEDEKDAEKVPNRITIRINYGAKLFHTRQGEPFKIMRPLSFAELPKFNIGPGSDISSFFLPQVKLEKGQRVRNRALELGYESVDLERIFRLNLIEVEKKTNVTSTLLVIEKDGQKSLEIKDFSHKRVTIATADIPSPEEGLDQRMRFHVEAHAEPPEWFVKLIQQTKVSSSGINLELPESNETSVVVSSVRYSERLPYRSKIEKNSDIPCTVDATTPCNTDWPPTTYELALVKTYEKQMEYFELSLRLVPEGISWKIVQSLSRNQIESMVEGLLKESDRLTEGAFSP